MTSSNTNGVSVSYTYDTLNRLATVVDSRLPAGQNTTTYSYDPASNLATVTYPNGLQSQFTHDTLNRVTAMNAAKASYSYTLSPTGNRTAAVESSGRTLNWSYDNIYRLTNETISLDPHSVNGSVGYGLDPVGNRQSQTSSIPGIGTGDYTYDPDDRLSTETYDANGNTLTTGGKTFTYDFANRLKSMTEGTVAVTLAYDADGNRVAKTANGVTTRYLVDDLNPTGHAQVVEELTAGAVSRTYTYGPQRINQNQLISNTWTPSFYGYDGFGSVRTLTDTTGTVTDTYDYDAWGNTVNTTGTSPNVYLYRGEQYDSDLGLYYLRARYFNPLSGRFLTRDPKEHKPITSKKRPIDPTKFHKYLYAGADPINRLDPRGRDEIIEYSLQIGESEESVAALQATKTVVQDELLNACIEVTMALYENIDMVGVPLSVIYSEAKAYCYALMGKFCFPLTSPYHGCPLVFHRPVRSLGFIQNFNARNCGVVRDGLKGQVQLSLCRCFQAIKGFGQCMEAARLFVDVEVVQQSLAVAHHAKYAASGATASG